MIHRLLDWDGRISARLRVAEKPGPLRSASALFAHSGDSWLWLGGLVLVYLWGDAAWKLWAATFVFGILFTATAVMALKFTIRRRRPAGEWGQIYRKTDPHSFPSGHAARAFLLPVMAAMLGPGWFAGALFVWGPLVALARVAMGVHYVVDVIAGALLGILMSFGSIWVMEQLVLRALPVFS